MRWLIIIVMLMGVGSSWAQPTNSAGIPAEVVDLCRILKDQIINRGDPTVVHQGVDHDIAGMPRPSGGGVDIGALECDSGATEPPGHGLVSLLIEVTPPAPQSCQGVRWTLQGQTDQVVSVRLYLRTANGRYTLGSPVLERATQAASVACAALPRPPSGSWWAMVKAIGVHGEDLGASNEVELRFDPLVVVHPPPPQVPHVPHAGIVKWQDLKAPPELLVMPKIPTAAMRGGASLSESEIWNGRRR